MEAILDFLFDTNIFPIEYRVKLCLEMVAILDFLIDTINKHFAKKHSIIIHVHLWANQSSSTF